MEQQLAEEPPADRLIAVYFAAQKWWSPPDRTDASGAAADGDPEIWESDLPDVTE